MKYIITIILISVLLGCTKPPPKILIIGDSISIGYTPHVKELLGGKAIVSHNEGNAQHTGTGMEKIQEWIGEEDWDIVQFNWGLWDLAYRHEDSKEQGQRDKVNDIYEYSKEVHTLYGTAADNVHYTTLGYRKLAEKIIEGLSQFDSRLADPPGTGLYQ